MKLLDRLWCHLCQRCPLPEVDPGDDKQRLERAQAYIDLARLDVDTALRRERTLSDRRKGCTHEQQ